MSETKPDLMAELAEVVRLSERATQGKWMEWWLEASASQGEAFGRVIGPKYLFRNRSEGMDPNDAMLIAAAVNFLRTHHAELEAVVRDAGAYWDLIAGMDAEQVVAASRKYGDSFGLLKNAERYRWLRENVDWKPQHENAAGKVYLVATMVSSAYGDINDQVDAAIDQAMHDSALEG